MRASQKQSVFVGCSPCRSQYVFDTREGSVSLVGEGPIGFVSEKYLRVTHAVNDDDASYTLRCDREHFSFIIQERSCCDGRGRKVLENVG
jgi:hypothetical protein